jgi:hypothetical protein
MVQELVEPVVNSSLQPIRGNEGAPVLGPTNPAREAQGPDRYGSRYDAEPEVDLCG